MTRLDAGARYAFEAFTTPTVARLNVDNVLDKNVLDKDYRAASPFGSLYVGDPRTVICRHYALNY